MFKTATGPLFIEDADQINANLTKRVSPLEFFVLGTSITLLIVIAFQIVDTYGFPYDYTNYMYASHGDYREYYYPYWFLLFFKVLGLLPDFINFTLWSILNILGVWFASRVFNSNKFWALLNYQMVFSLIAGQIVGLMIFGVALYWWGYVNKKWHLSGLGLVFAAAKIQSGFIFVFFIWLLLSDSWKNRMRVLPVPIFFTICTLLVFPEWPTQVLATIQANPPNPTLSIALWRWIGPWALLFWVLPILLPFENRKIRILSLWAAVPLGVPYFQQADLTALFVLPINPLLISLGYVGFLPEVNQVSFLPFLGIIPLFLYAAINIPALINWFKEKSPQQPAT